MMGTKSLTLLTTIIQAWKIAPMTYQHVLKYTISSKWILSKLLMAPLSCFMVATNINIWHTFMTTALVTMKVTMATITTFFHWWKQCCWKCICFWGKWYSYLFFMLLLLSIDFPQRPILLLMIKDCGNYNQWLIITSSMMFLPMEIVVTSFSPKVLTIMNQSKVFTPSLNTGSRWE